MSKSNRLIHSTSPYLLQHAHNPVDWFEWSEEALTKAINEDKPILISIGYSSCHWCHVMERESFEDENIASIMNQHFVCIKVDREERPDIDQIYMEAVQAMQQHGGWPLNVFLTPEQKPFYGGTYFPSKNWAELLLQISKAFQQKRNEINASAEDLRTHLQTSDLNRFAKEPGSEKFSPAVLDKMFQILSSRFDKKWGGMEKEPKFVMPTIWLFLLRYYSVTKNKEALAMVNLTLTKMSMGGLYDQIGGGFSRYSVDGEWFAPHFEKMLYDNAQLMSLYSEAYATTKDDLFKSIVYESTDWLRREMMHPDGGFYSALDADSEGEEGKFYTWTWEELTKVLTKHDVTAEYYNATEQGNWEHGRNILVRSENELSFLSDYNINKHDLDILIKAGRDKLLEARSHRIRPSLDDKVLTGWNAMMVAGLIDAYKAFGDEAFLNLAIKNITFLESQLIHEGKVYRAFKNKRSETEGFLEDYAFLIQAYAALYQVTFDERRLSQASKWCEHVMDHFYDREERYFHFSSKGAEKLIARRKEIFDNVIPASNSVMARNLYHLGILLDRDDWKTMAMNMTSRLVSTIESEPGYTSNWGILLAEIIHGMSEVVIVGRDAKKLAIDFCGSYQPFALTMGTESISSLPLLRDRHPKEGKNMIYVCIDKTCKLPVETAEEAIKQLTEI